MPYIERTAVGKGSTYGSESGDGGFCTVIFQRGVSHFIDRFRVRAEVEDQTAPATDLDPVDYAWNLLHPRVQVVAQQRFSAGHYADAVEATLKELASVIRSLVLQRAGPELDGVSLMQTAFSPKNPIIVLADLSTQSGRDMQRGYMDLFAGTMAAIRNPKAHGNIVITAERALHLLFLASMLWYTLDERP